MRQLIFWLIALLLIYGGWQFFRALHAGFRQQADSPSAKKTKAVNLDDDLFNYTLTSTKESDPGVTVAVYSHKRPDIAVPENANEIPLDPFAIELELQRLRLEISTLRETIEAQQKKIESLRADAQYPSTARIEPTISPITQEPDMSPEYDEALALARRGIVADIIASRCGITRAEADLVASLAAQGRQQQAIGGVL
ncbi:MAG: DUF2802 domain-containing protein [Betaproteobacteria bacterium]|nr:DUF2802 domain-containing protein [Betaproteobacteria bacterium]